LETEVITDKDMVAMRRDVTKFHILIGDPHSTSPVPPGDWGHTIRNGHPADEFRKYMICEETDELCEALTLADPVAVLREGTDLLYIAFGNLVCFGLPAPPGPRGSAWADGMVDAEGTIKHARHLQGSAVLALDRRAAEWLQGHVRLTTQFVENLFRQLTRGAVGIEHVWPSVHRANMQKIASRDGIGKPVKPEGWRPPDIQGILHRLT
jgi:hypothetical protein